jgi:predicted pyridoxine 5'-phosphate oxidase superfamily flavin-nucleotide-binding protein
MGHQFSKTMFTDAVKRLQERYGSRTQYERMAESGPRMDELGADEMRFISERDSFYIASLGSNEWPYMQHRGGPKGFLKVVDAKTLAFADLAGNKQYVSTGNFTQNDKVTLFLMDYPRQVRLKIIGHAEIVELNAEPELIKAVALPAYKAKIERIIRIRIVGFDWNCQQHITPRFTQEDILREVEPMQRMFEEMKVENETLRENARMNIAGFKGSSE